MAMRLGRENLAEVTESVSSGRGISVSSLKEESDKNNYLAELGHRREITIKIIGSNPHEPVPVLETSFEFPGEDRVTFHSMSGHHIRALLVSIGQHTGTLSDKESPIDTQIENINFLGDKILSCLLHRAQGKAKAEDQIRFLAEMFLRHQECHIKLESVPNWIPIEYMRFPSPISSTPHYSDILGSFPRVYQTKPKSFSNINKLRPGITVYHDDILPSILKETLTSLIREKFPENFYQLVPLSKTHPKDLKSEIVKSFNSKGQLQYFHCHMSRKHNLPFMRMTNDVEVNISDFEGMESTNNTVFLNGCSSHGHEGEAPWDLSGSFTTWAEQFTEEIECEAAIAVLSKTDDFYAKAFAKKFYDQMYASKRKDSIFDVFCRSKIDLLTDNIPQALMYRYFGNPVNSPKLSSIV
ncbi:hypothetical protein [Thalassospira tepidiphila]|uniref:hypothetical protein n=1 Tax=Thalassospira tepidiphila TaxID=393657 RepID=UPI0029219893|nr:hypothetical protein MACH01_17850 [Thalassospira tepidiphila]